QQAARAGADAVGLIFHPPSPRAIDEMRAQFLLRHLPPFVEAVGVFVDRPLAEAADLAARLGRIHTLQMHGQGKEIASTFPFHYIPAFQIRRASDLDTITRFLEQSRDEGMLPSAILVDGHAPG